MPFKFNPLTGQLDLVNSTSSGTGNVTGIPPTDIRAIARWVDTTGTTIENSKTLIQDGGGIEAQGFITNKQVTDSLSIGNNQVMLTTAFSVELDGELIIESDGELAIV